MNIATLNQLNWFGYNMHMLHEVKPSVFLIKKNCTMFIICTGLGVKDMVVSVANFLSKGKEGQNQILFKLIKWFK